MAVALSRLDRSMQWLAGGAGLGVALAIMGVLGATLIARLTDPTNASGTWLPILLTLPFVVFYGLALRILVSVRRRIRAGIADSNVVLIHGAYKASTTAIVFIAIGLAPAAYVTVFGFLGVMGVNSPIALIEWLASWGSQVPPTIGAIIAFQKLGECRRAMRLRISDDGRWWWDGDAWQLIKSGADRIKASDVQPRDLDGAKSRARLAAGKSFYAMAAALALAVLLMTATIITNLRANTDAGVIITILLVFGLPPMVLALGATVALGIAWRSFFGAWAVYDRSRWSTSRRWAKAARVCLWVCVPPAAYAALALAFGVLFATTDGDRVAIVASDVAEWILLSGAIVALVYAFVAVRTMAGTISSDIRWWWDGATWRPLGPEAAATGPAVVGSIFGT